MVPLLTERAPPQASVASAFPGAFPLSGDFFCRPARFLVPMALLRRQLRPYLVQIVGQDTKPGMPVIPCQPFARAAIESMVLKAVDVAFHRAVPVLQLLPSRRAFTLLISLVLECSASRSGKRSVSTNIQPPERLPMKTSVKRKGAVCLMQPRFRRFYPRHYLHAETPGLFNPAGLRSAALSPPWQSL